MKKLNNQKKLTKKALKNITGGNGPAVCWDGFCRRGEFEEWQLGAGDKNGYCC